MRESERRIKEYQPILIQLREKVSIVGMLLVISVILMVTASFAWVTLSKNPEVSGMSTTVSANGNLEIALSDTDGLEPDASQVGDSKLPLLERNLTWGNLVNLSDSSYGLEHLVLRPATLNRSALDTSPLFAATYSSDGRVEGLTSSFAYTNYDPEMGRFLVSDVLKYGVRAISSVTYTYAEGTQAYYERLNKVNTALGLARSSYDELVASDGDYMQVVCNIIGDYLTCKFGDSLDTYDFGKYTENMYDMMLAFKEAMDATGETYIQLANFQLYIANPMTNNYYTTLESLFGSKDSVVTGMNGFASFKSDYNKLSEHITTMESLKNGYVENKTPVYWSQFSNIVTFMADINSTQVDGMPVSSIGMDEAASLVLQGSKVHTAVIYKGALYRMENRIGTYMYAKNMTVNASYSGLSVSLKANVTTNAYTEQADEINTKLKAVTESGGTGGAVATAADTYGMAVDFWVRSNADEDYLILEGRVLTEKVQKTDDAGRLYFKDPETGKTILKDGDTYYDTDGNVYTLGVDVTPEIIYEEVVVGYEGTNRVWDEIEEDNSVTQGGGSYYSFNANPQTLDQSLKLLDAMRVAFIDEEGTLLTTAYFDTEHYYASTGEIVVPLALASTSTVAGTDSVGNDVYAITQLPDKEAMRITALVYIDGNVLTNQEVLSKDNIQGQLNIQLGSFTDLEPMMDDELYYDEVSVSATASETYFPELNVNGVNSTISLTVDGIEPSKVTANFIRKINDTQGTRQDTLTFTKVSEGSYQAVATFMSPGTYILKSVSLDGIDYKLSNTVEIVIDGFKINTVGWNYANNYVKILSADTYHQEEIWVQFGGNSKQPTKVQAIFANEDNQQITVNLNNTAVNWKGTASFYTSGTYTMKYILVDGEYYEVPTSSVKIIDLSLGMKAKVAVSETRFDYDGTPKSVNVYVTVSDNKGEALTELENVSLQYMLQGSSMVENGLYADLTWDAEAGAYTGIFTIDRAGAFGFGYLTINGNTISSAEAPVIQAIPPDTPEYYGNLTGAETFAAGQNAYMKISVKSSSFIADNEGMVAVLSKDGQEIHVGGIKSAHIFTDGEDSSLDLTDWSFKIPTDDDLAELGILQEGTWQITGLYIVGAYKDGVFHEAENPMEVDLSNKNIVTNVSNKMQVVVTGDGGTATSQFLVPKMFTEGLTVKVQSPDGIPATGIDSMTVTYRLDDANVTKSTGEAVAGYTSDSLSTIKSYGAVSVKMLQTSPGVFELSNENVIELKYQGNYYIDNVEFTMYGDTYVTSSSAVSSDKKLMESENVIMTDAPKFTFNWSAPVVKITGVNPSGSITVCEEYHNTLHYIVTDTVSNTYSDYSVVANMKATTGKVYYKAIVGTYSYTGVTALTVPNVSTAISAYGNYTKAKLLVQKGSDGDWQNTYFDYTVGTDTSTISIGAAQTATDAKNNTYCSGANTLGSGTATYITVTGGTGNEVIQYVFKLANPLSITQNY